MLCRQQQPEEAPNNQVYGLTHLDSGICRIYIVLSRPDNEKIILIKHLKVVNLVIK